MKKQQVAQIGDQNASEIHLLGDGFVGGTLSQLANYSDLFNQLTEAVLLVDQHGHRILECNPSAMLLFQATHQSEICGKTLEELLVTEAPAKEAPAWQSLWLGHSKIDYEYQDPKLGLRFFEVKSDPLRILDYVEIRQVIILDVTEIKRAQKEIETTNEILKKLSTTDSLTGIWNVRYLKERLAVVHQESERLQQPYGVIFIDVDHFKQFNDKNGHPAGDEVLKQVANLLKTQCHERQTPTRYGGEEFVILCEDSTLKEVAECAERIQKTIEQTPFPYGDKQPLGKVTASLGVAVFPQHAGSPEQLLKNADEALYQAKQSGRNQVKVYSKVEAIKKAS